MQVEIDMNIVGQRIKIARENKNLTQEQLAQALSKDKQSVWRWENNKRGIQFKTINKIAKILDCNILFLLGYDDKIESIYDETGHKLRQSQRHDTIGERIRDKRKEKGISISNFAALLDMTEQEVHEIEISTKTVSGQQAKKISKILDVEMNVLMGLERVPSTSSYPRNFDKPIPSPTSRFASLEDFAIVREVARNLESLDNRDLDLAKKMLLASLEALEKEEAIRTAKGDGAVKSA